MKTRAEIPASEMLALLAKTGWVLIDKEDGPDWWAREMWALKSAWSPKDAVAYLAFLVDPHDDAQTPRIYAVRASRLKPRVINDGPGEFTLYLGKGWSKHIQAFEDFLTELH